ncbi:MAG: hypothetical protein Q9166_003343 [cf. Caloplaca sp. 2 TL-2023]
MSTGFVGERVQKLKPAGGQDDKRWVQQNYTKKESASLRSCTPDPFPGRFIADRLKPQQERIPYPVTSSPKSVDQENAVAWVERQLTGTCKDIDDFIDLFDEQLNQDVEPLIALITIWPQYLETLIDDEDCNFLILRPRLDMTRPPADSTRYNKLKPLPSGQTYAHRKDREPYDKDSTVGVNTDKAPLIDEHLQSITNQLSNRELPHGHARHLE